MGKCRFNEVCLEKNNFKCWLKPVPGNQHEARCTLCKKNIRLGTLGIKALESHAKSVKHVMQMRELRQARYLSIQSPADPRPPPATQLSATAVQVPGTATATQGIIDVAMGSAPTLRAEILWTLQTVVKHQSYNSNEGIGKLFPRLLKNMTVVVAALG